MLRKYSIWDLIRIAIGVLVGLIFAVVFFYIWSNIILLLIVKKLLVS